MTRVLSWPIDRLQRLLGFVYYEFLFDTGSSWSTMLAPRVQVWEQQRGKGDTPIPQTLWEEQYTSGHWNFLRSLDELGRFSVMIGYLHSLKPDGAVLDIGCGEGVLFERMQPAGCAQYLGIDISAEAVNRARSRSAGTFVCADAERFVPTDTYDAILFNESLYYFVDPVGAVVRYATALRPGGIMIVSTFLRSRRGRAILRALKRKFTVLDETSITHDTRTWTCSVLAHTPQPVSRP
jgi:SAM-dependent methyltransferase